MQCLIEMLRLLEVSKKENYTLTFKGGWKIFAGLFAFWEIILTQKHHCVIGISFETQNTRDVYVQTFWEEVKDG